MEEEDRQRMMESLEDIFAHLQCLPDSEQFMSAKAGRIWSRVVGEQAIAVLVNPIHVKFQSIGRTMQVRDAPHWTHVT